MSDHDVDEYYAAKLAAKDREIAALREALRSARKLLDDGEVMTYSQRRKHWDRIDAISGSPSPDPAEAMRAKDADRYEIHPVRAAIAALKGKGEGL